MSTRPLRKKRQEQHGVSRIEYVNALIDNPALYELADLIDGPDPSRGGRPRSYPDWVILFFDCLADVVGSARGAATELAGEDGHLWNHIRRLVEQKFPDRPERHLPPEPLTREAYNRRRKYVLRSLEALRVGAREAAAAQALEQGFADPDGPGSPSHPNLDRMLHQDGKVISAPTRYSVGDTREVRITDPTTGEVTTEHRPRRACVDAKLHTTGDKRQIHGSKFHHIDIRGAEDAHDRIIVNVAHVAGVKGERNSEADVMVRETTAVVELLPGIQGTLTDGVTRGAHLDVFQRDLGLVVVSPTPAERVDKKTGTRTLKSQPLTDHTFTYPDGSTETVEIHTHGGALAIKALDDHGKVTLQDLKWLRTIRRTNSDGTYRFYVEYEVPDPRGGPPGVHREATITGEADRATGFNRSENVRQIPWSSDERPRLYGRRADSEAINRIIEDHLPLKRARSFGAQAQLHNLISHQLVVNSLGRYRCRKRLPRAERLAA